MRLIANDVNKDYFRNLLEYGKVVPKVDIAVAYITDETIFEYARASGISLNVWCRIDEDVHPQTLTILSKYIADSNINFYATHDFLHSKILWFHGVGCYIGSANLTGKALHDNIEMGIFLEENVDPSEIFEQIQTFFLNLPQYTTKLVREDIDRLKKHFNNLSNDPHVQRLNDEMRKAKKRFNEDWRKLKEALFADQKKPHSMPSNKSQHQKRFVSEWKETQGILERYKEIYAAEYSRPSWVNPDLPVYAEIDKMFDWHYSSVLKGDKKIGIIVEEEHQRNSGKGDENIKKLFNSWSGLSECPDEEIMYSFNTRAPVTANLLSKDKIQKLTNNEIATVVFNCYALMDHIDQFKSYESLKIDRTGERASREEKASRFVEHFLSSPNRHNKTFIEILNYFIWSDSPPWEKIWDCTDDKSKWKYPGIDRSTLGELIGLARPDKYPVRNNRISRVLYALGFDVDHF